MSVRRRAAFRVVPEPVSGGRGKLSPGPAKSLTLDVNNVSLYYEEDLMIRSFRSRDTQEIFHGRFVKGVDGQIQQRAREKLKYLDSAVDLHDLLVPPANALEALKGDRKGQHSIRINKQWRLCFTWKDGDAFDVEVVDYH